MVTIVLLKKGLLNLRVAKFKVAESKAVGSKVVESKVLLDPRLLNLCFTASELAPQTKQVD